MSSMAPHTTVSPHIDVWDASAEIAYWCWWCLTTQTLVNIGLLIGWKFSRPPGKLFQALYFKQPYMYNLLAQVPTTWTTAQVLNNLDYHTGTQQPGLPHRLSKCQSLSTTKVLFRTTFTRTIKVNLLFILFLSNKNDDDSLAFKST